jgi:flagellar biosynthesis/type III secretory pathway chaperone
MAIAWESELAEFLRDLSAVQAKTLDVLIRKRQMLVAADAAGLVGMAGEEQEVMESLERCLDRREELLERARQEALPADNLRALAKALPPSEQGSLADQMREAAHRTRLLQHHSLTNWVLVQKTLIHLSQLLEIIATGGQFQPTYGRDQCATTTVALVDRAA